MTVGFSKPLAQLNPESTSARIASQGQPHKKTRSLAYKLMGQHSGVHYVCPGSLGVPRNKCWYQQFGNKWQSCLVPLDPGLKPMSRGSVPILYFWPAAVSLRHAVTLCLLSQIPLYHSAQASNEDSTLYLSPAYFQPSPLPPLKFPTRKMEEEQPQLIEANEIAEATEYSLVYHPKNPDYCACGWYYFYSNICHHMCRQQPYKCGRTHTASLSTGFCKIPAPRNVVQGYVVNARCASCQEGQDDR
ncbi:hypothetical protein F4778DRAFT_745384 [Xylariomycetidae sp. FL2044]|nr:hypothetical protein F4778DRAFT_745384 [Xylariomycetidae sp. FL2044]